MDELKVQIISQVFPGFSLFPEDMTFRYSHTAVDIFRPHTSVLSSTCKFFSHLLMNHLTGANTEDMI